MVLHSASTLLCNLGLFKNLIFCHRLQITLSCRSDPFVLRLSQLPPTDLVQVIWRLPQVHLYVPALSNFLCTSACCRFHQFGKAWHLRTKECCCIENKTLNLDLLWCFLNPPVPWISFVKSAWRLWIFSLLFFGYFRKKIYLEISCRLCDLEGIALR